MYLIEALQNNAVLFYGVVAFLGLFVGSFLNVVIYRLPVMMENEWRQAMQEMAEADKANAENTAATLATTQASESQTTEPQANETFNLSVPRSRCPKCNQLITWWQNIPVISYLFLGGKCHGCKTPISIRYPAIEVITMLLSLAVAWQFGPSWQTALGILTTWFLVAMTMIDFDHQLLPDSLTLPLMWIGLLASLIPIFADVQSAVIGAAAGYLVLWMVFHLFKLITGKEGMGYGDFKLLAALGALLGWQMLPMVILLSSLVGAVVGITLIAVSGRDKNIPIPFGPYLAAAGWLAMMWGEQITNAYLGLFAV
jgi:leader peptidase (prepilin peptidase)/N-methyltransferase